MDIDEYFKSLSEGFSKEYEIAKEARKKGFDPKDYVEIKEAPDLASRVEGIIGVEGIAEIIRSKERNGKTRTEVTFDVAKEICTNPKFDSYAPIKRIELAVKVGLAMLTDGVTVAPTEGLQTVEEYKNPDGTNYIAVSYAGPIRSAGGTAAALSVAIADYARQFFNIGPYKPTQKEIERYVEEAEIYNKVARLQYRPTDDDIRVIVSNCPVCVDGVATEDVEVSGFRDITRIKGDKQVLVTNRVRGGVSLVICECIAQKAKKLVKEVKTVGLDWSWLNSVIKVDKVVEKGKEEQKRADAFLEELVAGRPILSYPGFVGGFRLRYGRSRLTGIAAKGFNPATMIVLDDFIAVGTQLKVEYPGKGCVAAPVDSIEGPFVKLSSGEALRINTAEQARELKDQIVEIISLGDILITYGDFKKSNTTLQPSSYVEEFWLAELKEKDPSADVNPYAIDFKEAYSISQKYGIPIHPRFLYEFQAASKEELTALAMAILRNSEIVPKTDSIFEVKELKISNAEVKPTLESLNVPHKFIDENIVVVGDDAKALIASLGFVKGIEGKLEVNELVLDKYNSEANDPIELMNSIAPFRIMKRSAYVGARIGRPEKAKERLMKPAPNVLFPISSYGGKERNIASAYSNTAKKFGNYRLKVEIARYKCPKCKRITDAPFCYDCNMPTVIERVCPKCGLFTTEEICPNCKIPTIASEEREIDIVKTVDNAMRYLGITKLPQVIKGVKRMMNKDKTVERLEKGILRSTYNVYTFKDGTARVDATDTPITHFYPDEIGVSVGKLRELGYTTDYLGNPLEHGDQLVELRHQDIILNKHNAEYLLNVAKFVDALLEKFYNLPRFYNANKIDDLVGKLVITLAPHTSCGVLGKIVGFTDANVGFAHPYTISARRRNCDGDEDSAMLLLDALLNFSRSFLPSTIGGTMDAPLILTVNVHPEEVDDEVHAMEVVNGLSLEFYRKSLEYAAPSDVKVEVVGDRLGKKEVYSNILFTHETSPMAIKEAPKKSRYTTLKSMKEKVDTEFKLMNMIRAINKKDAAKKLILSHFIPDLIGNLHSFSKQIFRCSVCNTKYRRMPLSGKCPKDGGKILLTISKGSIEKYLNMAIELADRYDLEPYIKQRLKLIKADIGNIFGEGEEGAAKQFNLSRFI